jgi:hypothetical protein
VKHYLHDDGHVNVHEYAHGRDDDGLLYYNRNLGT